MRAALALLLVLGGCATAPADPDSPVPLTAQAVPLDTADPARDRIGELRYLGGLVLRSSDPRFGGLSGLRLRDDGRGLAVTDAGDWVAFRLVERGSRPLALRDVRMAPLRFADGSVASRKADVDAESLEWSPNGDVAVAFEVDHRIQRYRGIDPARPASLRSIAAATERPPGWQDWPRNDGPEAFARAPDGGELSIGESESGDGAHDGFLARGGATVAFRYNVPGDVVPTDAIYLDAARVLVLHRGFSRLKGVSAMIGIVDAAAIRPGATVAPRELARFAPPLTIDNMEGIAVRRERGRTAIYIVSDDNFSGSQRTLLMKFALAD